MFRAVWSILALALIAVSGIWACVHVIRTELAREASYQQQYGDKWIAEYTETFGSLSQARTRIVIAYIGVIGITLSALWLIKVLKDGGRSKNQPRPARRHEPMGERRVRFKRNALLGVYFGVPGILASVMLAIFRMGIFEDHRNEVTLAIFVFMGAYCAVMSGCYWWLKAKEWNEGLIVIGCIPLAIFFVPFVRLIVFTQPMLLLAAMVMMPLILVVVVAVLPDKSGANRRAPWERPKHRRHRSET